MNDYSKLVSRMLGSYVHQKKLVFIAGCMVTLAGILIYTYYGALRQSSQPSHSYHHHHTHVSNTYIFHLGMDSIGGNIEQIEPVPSVESLKEQCKETPECVGFTSEGYLKKSIRPFNEWTATENVNTGLYTLDINYCKIFGISSCSNEAVCIDNHNGTYFCLHRTSAPTQPTTTTSRPNISFIHVVTSIDSKAIKGLLALMQSIKEHTDYVVVHVVVDASSRKSIENRVRCTVSETSTFKIEYTVFDVSSNFHTLMKVSKSHLSSTANFKRFFFAKMFPKLSHIIYIDVDVIVLHNLSELWKQVVKIEDKLLVIVPRFSKCSKHFNQKVSILYSERYPHKNFTGTCANFNAGVVGINLNKWRRNEITDEVLYWMKQNSIRTLWGLGTQPIMQIVSHDDWTSMDKRWNTEGLGFKTPDKESISSAYILHWNGSLKPWKIKKPDVHYRYIWDRYNKRECRGNGSCRYNSTDNTAPRVKRCVCHSTYTGNVCEHKL